MDHRRIFNAKTGAIAGAVLTPVAAYLYATNPEFKQLPLEKIVEIAAVTLPINICVGAAIAYGFGHLMNYKSRMWQSYRQQS